MAAAQKTRGGEANRVFALPVPQDFPRTGLDPRSTRSTLVAIATRFPIAARTVARVRRFADRGARLCCAALALVLFDQLLGLVQVLFGRLFGLFDHLVKLRSCITAENLQRVEHL